MADLDLSGDDGLDAKPPKGTVKGGGDKPPTEGELRRRIEEGLVEVVELVESQLRWPDVAEVMRADVKRMSEVLAVRAGRHERVGRIVVFVFGKDSILAAGRAFGPTLRAIGAHLPWRRERDEIDGEAEEETAEPWHDAQRA